MSLDIGMECNWVCYREHARWNLVQAGLLRSEMSDTVGFGGCVWFGQFAAAVVKTDPVMGFKKHEKTDCSDRQMSASTSIDRTPNCSMPGREPGTVEIAGLAEQT